MSPLTSSSLYMLLSHFLRLPPSQSLLLSLSSLPAPPSLSLPPPSHSSSIDLVTCLSFSPIDCPAGWRKRQGHCYGVVNATDHLENIGMTSVRSAFAANKVCEEFNGSLPVITDNDIQQTIEHMIMTMVTYDHYFV